MEIPATFVYVHSWKIFRSTSIKFHLFRCFFHWIRIVILWNDATTICALDLYSILYLIWDGNWIEIFIKIFYFKLNSPGNRNRINKRHLYVSCSIKYSCYIYIISHCRGWKKNWWKELLFNNLTIIFNHLRSNQIKNGNKNLCKNEPPAETTELLKRCKFRMLNWEIPLRWPCRIHSQRNS